MKFRPIIFSTPMVRAVLEGRKTQTRRIVKHQPDIDGLHDHTRFPMSLQNDQQGWWGTDDITGEMRQFKCQYGQPRDILWVRETWLSEQMMDGDGFIMDENGHPIDKVWYKASDSDLRWYEDSDFPRDSAPWKPSIHMPKSACRIFLEITDIHVQRLRDITEADAFAEGVRFTDFGKDRWGRQERGYHVLPVTTHEQCLETAQTAFGNLWNKIHGEDQWDSNPWIWAISFKCVDKPECFA